MTINEDTRIVKASFRECELSDRKKFPFSNCIMPISVGQAVHEGKKFFATLALINNSFKECTLLVDDSIQRHTMRIDSSENEESLYQQAIKAGDHWLERNKFIYERLSIPYTILRWDDWLKNAEFNNAHKIVKEHYNSNEGYRHEIHQNITEFLSRYFDRYIDISNINYQQAFTYCLEYLLEECAVMCLWAEARYDFEVYPAGRNKAMTATYNYIIKPKYPTVLKSVALRFKKYPSPNLTESTHQKDQNLNFKNNELTAIE